MGGVLGDKARCIINTCAASDTGSFKKIFKEHHFAHYLDKTRYLTRREFLIVRMRINIKQPTERELIQLVLMSGLPLVPLSKQSCSFG